MFSKNRIVHRPNVFPKRDLGPMGIDIQGEQFINGGVDRVYFYKFWGLKQGAGLSSEMCAYFPYKGNGTLDETMSIEMPINDALDLLGVSELKPGPTKKTIHLPDMDKVIMGKKKKSAKKK
jgi:hypothetical protein